MKSTTRSRRLRNTHQHDEKHQEPFFTQSQEHERSPFFSMQQFGSGEQAVQTKLTIGKPGDRYEQEADRVANDVVARSSQSPELQRQETDSIQRVPLMPPAEDEKLEAAEASIKEDELVQEKIQMEEQEEEPVQMKEEEELVQAEEKEEEESIQAKEEEEEESVQAKEEGCNVVSPDAGQKIKNATGAGQPLSGEVLTEMEHAFGADFSGVNIHTDAEAIRLNEQLHSRAFTRGQDIFFNEGMYRPETSEGKRLLAHELTHVVQQRGWKRAAGNKRPK